MFDSWFDLGLRIYLVITFQKYKNKCFSKFKKRAQLNPRMRRTSTQPCFLEPCEFVNSYPRTGRTQLLMSKFEAKRCVLYTGECSGCVHFVRQIGCVQHIVRTTRHTKCMACVTANMNIMISNILQTEPIFKNLGNLKLGQQEVQTKRKV